MKSLTLAKRNGYLDDMTKTLVPLEGHEFKPLISTEEDDRGQTVGISEVFAGCTCDEWESEQGHSPMGNTKSELADAEEQAKRDWERKHYPKAAVTAVPRELADRVRAVEGDVDQLMQAYPLAALRLAVQSGGLFSAKAKAAALQASLDHSWAEIGTAIGISKQAAWERFGKYRTVDSTP